MPEFIDREEEIAALETEYARSGSSLVVIYGRRRIGKTSLIQHFLKEKPAVYFLATEENEDQNRSAFRLMIAAFTNNELLGSSAVEEWRLIFEALCAFPTKKKKVLVIDEFQYLGKANPAFPSVLQKIWDTALKDQGLMLILCGSLISMMVSQTLAYESPLYGRRTAQIRLKQISFRYYSKFFTGAQKETLIPFYAVTGGVPKYIELCAGRKDVYDLIIRDVISRSSFLYDEPHFLLYRELGQVGSYFSIIKTIAAGNRKLGDIAANLGIKQTGLTKYLETLISLDILEREVPVTETHPEKSKRGLYRIKDNFIAFWFRFIYPDLSYIEAGNTGLVMKKIRRNFVDNHVSFIYEDICREKLIRMNAVSGWPRSWRFHIDKSGRFWDKNTEIDIVAFDSGGVDIVFCECKYVKKPIDPEVLYALEQKAEAVDWKRAERVNHYMLFSTSGFNPELTAAAKKRKDVALILV
ncbi:MAG: ATP-binding protein [Spirochaetales bacterium]|jgi:AAA+ ATPase superfamily predicted ATPase|nr:ATP-binding protein [Spirochaetales bacterium]